MSAGKFFFMILLVVLLAGRFFFFFNSQTGYQDKEQVSFTAILQEEPVFTNGKQEFRVTTPDGVKVRVITSTASVYSYGQTLFIDGIFTKKEYKGHEYLVIYFPTLQIVDKEVNVFTQLALFLVNKAKSLYEATLPPQSASLLLGMIFGGNQGLNDDFLEKLRTTGVLHVIAASGMNVSFVAGALLAILGKLLRRQWALCIGILGIVFYALLAGFDPPVVRAAIMASIAFSASLLGRQNVAVLSLFITAYVMLFFDPLLLGDIGFQLSFSATLGILVIKPLFGVLERLGLVGEDVATTFAAQLSTLPILLTMFGQYGVLSLFVNALVLWIVPIVMVFGSLGLVVGLLLPPLGKLFILLCLPFLLFFEWMISVFGSVGGLISLESFPLSLSIGYYLLLTAGVLFLQNKRKEVKDTRTKRKLRDEIGI